jgi:hypothetical protein
LKTSASSRTLRAMIHFSGRPSYSRGSDSAMASCRFDWFV